MSKKARLAKAARRRPRSLYLWSAGVTYRRLDTRQPDWVQVDFFCPCCWPAPPRLDLAAYARRRKARTRRNRR